MKDWGEVLNQNEKGEEREQVAEYVFTQPLLHEQNVTQVQYF